MHVGIDEEAGAFGWRVGYGTGTGRCQEEVVILYCCNSDATVEKKEGVSEGVSRFLRRGRRATSASAPPRRPLIFLMTDHHTHIIVERIVHMEDRRSITRRDQ